MPGPGEYLPDPTEGITRVEDLPKPKIVRRSRDYRRRPCPDCGHRAYRDRRVKRLLHDAVDSPRSWSFFSIADLTISTIEALITPRLTTASSSDSAGPLTASFAAASTCSFVARPFLMSTRPKRFCSGLNSSAPLNESVIAWLVADIDALRAFYGPGFNPNPIPKNPNVERIDKNTLEPALRKASRGTTKGEYRKARHTPLILERLDVPRVREAAFFCDRLFETIEGEMTAP